MGASVRRWGRWRCQAGWRAAGRDSLVCGPRRALPLHCWTAQSIVGDCHDQACSRCVVVTDAATACRQSCHHVPTYLPACLCAHPRHLGLDCGIMNWCCALSRMLDASQLIISQNSHRSTPIPTHTYPYLPIPPYHSFVRGPECVCRVATTSFLPKHVAACGAGPPRRAGAAARRARCPIRTMPFGWAAAAWVSGASAAIAQTPCLRRVPASAFGA